MGLRSASNIKQLPLPLLFFFFQKKEKRQLTVFPTTMKTFTQKNPYVLGVGNIWGLGETRWCEKSKCL